MSRPSGVAAGSAEGVAISFENHARRVRNDKTPVRESYMKQGEREELFSGLAVPVKLDMSLTR